MQNTEFQISKNKTSLFSGLSLEHPEVTCVFLCISSFPIQGNYHPQVCGLFLVSFSDFWVFLPICIFEQCIAEFCLALKFLRIILYHVRCLNW